MSGSLGNITKVSAIELINTGHEITVIGSQAGREFEMAPSEKRQLTKNKKYSVMKKITPHLYQLNLGYVNAFLIEDVVYGPDATNGAVSGFTLVDTGTPGYLHKIFSQTKKAGEDPRDIRRIIVTHTDHTGSAAAINKAFIQVKFNKTTKSNF